MTVETDSLRGVRNIYGERNTGGALGHVKTEGIVNELAVDISSEYVNGDAWAQVKLPAGSLIVGAYAEITSVFALGGTAPIINVGTEGSEDTNGVHITKAQAEAVGTYDIIGTIGGTWSTTASLAAETIVGVSLTGTTPTASGGKGRVVVQYVKAAG